MVVEYWHWCEFLKLIADLIFHIVHCLVVVSDLIDTKIYFSGGTESFIKSPSLNTSPNCIFDNRETAFIVFVACYYDGIITHNIKMDEKKPRHCGTGKGSKPYIEKKTAGMS